MKLRNLALCATFITALAACASIPAGPSVAVMLGPGKPFDQFNIDNSICKNFAQQELGSNPNDVAREQVLTGAAAGAVLGAASGALMGHGLDSPAGEMAGAGLIVGSAAGASAANRSTMTLQRRYDIAYQQCMYAKGNQVPGYAAPRYVCHRFLRRFCRVVKLRHYRRGVAIQTWFCRPQVLILYSAW